MHALVTPISRRECLVRWRTSGRVDSSRGMFIESLMSTSRRRLLRDLDPIDSPALGGLHENALDPNPPRLWLCLTLSLQRLFQHRERAGVGVAQGREVRALDDLGRR